MAEQTSPGTDYGTAVQNVAAILSVYCGRAQHGAAVRACPFDHTADAQAAVRSVVQHAFPELLRQLLAGADQPQDLVNRTVEKIAELEARALVVPPR
jgi:hypothetical protein